MSDQKLIFTTGVDLQGLDRDLRSAESMLAGFTGGGAARQLESIKGPSVDMARGAGDSDGVASVMAGSLTAIGPRIAAEMRTTLDQLKAMIGSAARTISTQLHDQLAFAKIQDDIKSTDRLYSVSLENMRRKAVAAKANGMNPIDLGKIHASIGQAENEFDNFLNHSAASLKKSLKLPTAPSFFAISSKSFAGPQVDTSKTSPAPFQTLGRAAATAGEQIRGMGLQIGLALGFVGAAYKATSALVGFFGSGLKGASDLNETLSKTDVVLGTASASVKAFADDMANRFGLVKGVTLDTASSFGGLARSLGGLSGAGLGRFSTQFTRLAADLSSFSNVSMQEAARAIQTGLAGNESDQLKSLGVVLNDATLKQYAYASGIARAGAELTEQQKFMARAGLITQGLAKVNGDLERTQGGAANQARKLSGSIANLGTSVGTALLPVLTQGIAAAGDFVASLAAGFEANKLAIASWVDSILDASDWAIASFHNIPAVFEVVRLEMLEKLLNVGEGFAVLGPNALAIARYIADNWLLLIGDAFDATLAGLKNLWANFQAIGTAIGEWFADPTKGFHVDWTPLLDGFRATAGKFPELLKPTLTDMSKQIAAAARPITAEVTARRAARDAARNAPAAVLKDTPTASQAIAPAGKTPRGDQKFLSEALELGSKEAYSAIVTARTGRPKGMEALERSGQQTANNTGQLVNLIRNQDRRPANLQRLQLP